MALNCDPDALAQAAKCFTCLDATQRKAVKIYLLATLAGTSTDPNVLAEAAKCFVGLSAVQERAIESYLLCQIANA